MDTTSRSHTSKMNGKARCEDEMLMLSRRAASTSASEAKAKAKAQRRGHRGRGGFGFGFGVIIKSSSSSMLLALLLLLLPLTSATVGAVVDTSSAGLGGSQSSRPDGADPTFDCEMRRLALEFAENSLMMTSSTKSKSGRRNYGGREGEGEGVLLSSVFDALELGALCGDEYHHDERSGEDGGGGHGDAEEEEEKVEDGGDGGEGEGRGGDDDDSSSEGNNALFVDALLGCDVTHAGTTRSQPLRTLHRAVELSRSLASSSASSSAQQQPRTIYLISGRGRVYHLPSTLNLDERDSNLIIAGYDPTTGGDGVDMPIVSGAVPLPPDDLEWVPATDIPHPHANVFVTRIPTSVPIDDIPGLHFSSPTIGASGRAVIARYPNTPNPYVFDPTLSGGDNRIPQGQATFLPPRNYSESDYEYVNVYEPSRNDTDGNWYSYYTVGVGGSCRIYDPPVSYWCSNSTRGGGASKFRVPTGIIFNSSFLPNLDFYSEEGMDDGAVVNVWRPARWANWMFLGEYNSTTRQFTFTHGGFQGGRGDDVGDDWFVENVLAELDSPNEYYYDRHRRMLYLCVNSTDGITHPDQLGQMSVPKLDTLFRIEGTSPDTPVTNVTLKGLHVTGTRHTHLSVPHGVPSGGDWALERSGAIFLENTVEVTVERCLIERVDGHGIFISGKNRHVTVVDNDVRFTGGSGIASWGRTDGELDERGYTAYRKLYPEGNRILRNTIHEIGHYEKQNAFYFQSKTSRTTIEHNVMYNGPRAGINFNDGFAGGDVIRSNLVFNTCRESGDHGPFNSWDRQPFVTPGSPQNGTGMEWRVIENNFFVANYHSQEAIDTDDGSAYYFVRRNFMVYSTNGLKSDFRGHDVHHSRNVYAYVGNCMNDDAQSPQLRGHEDAFHRNKCVLSPNGTYAYFDVTGSWPVMGNNEIYVTNEKPPPPPPRPGPNGTHTHDGYHRLRVNNYTIEEFQKKFPGVDDGTKVFYGGVDAESIVTWARDVLNMRSHRGEDDGVGSSSKKEGKNNRFHGDEGSLYHPEMAALGE